MEEVAAFHQELYEEHLEEASFLYELRAALIHDEEVKWVDLEAYDQRIQAHLDGLSGGGAHARRIALDAALGGEAGAVYVATRLLGAEKNLPELLTLLKALELDDSAIAQALTDGLCLGSPDAWFNALASFAENECPQFLPVLMRLLAWRRAPTGPEFLMRHRENPLVRAALSWSQCRLPMPQLRYETFRMLQTQPAEDHFSDGALALLQQGDAEFLTQLSPSMPWARIPLGLAGSRQQVRHLLQATPVTAHGLLALGLLGELQAIPALLNYLQSPDAAPSAARALNLITGAELQEEVFLAEHVEEEDLLEEEREAYRASGTATNPNGQPAGEFLVRLSQTPETWQTWWQNHGGNFNPSLRYRNGQPFTPTCLLENLRASHSPNLVRLLAHLEFQIRYGFSVPFELEMPIPQQKHAIQAYAEWVETHQTRFEPGQWYFAGVRQ